MGEMSTILNIKSKLKNIMCQRFELNPDLLCTEHVFDKELLGSTWNMSPIQLIYLLFDIEKEFSITIPEENIIMGKFNTLNNIAGLVEIQLQDKEKKVVSL